MGAFNEWVRGSFLEAPENRKTVTVAKNLLYGAAVLLRLSSLKSQGFSLDEGDFRIEPMSGEELDRMAGGIS